MLDKKDKQYSTRQQCKMLGLNRSGIYYKPVPISDETLTIMQLLDEEHTRHPFYGVRKMRQFLREEGYEIGKDRVRTLLRGMGLEAIYPTRAPKTSVKSIEHRIYPYLLKGVQITRPNQVWSADITYLRLEKGFAYLVAVIDWYSRYVLSWRLNNSLEAHFCIEALEEALKYGKPEIFNTDQGSQFTSRLFTDMLEEHTISISMDAKGKVFDNIFVERLWRTVKYEDIYLREYKNIPEVKAGLKKYFRFYNQERYHQSLEYKTPVEVFAEKKISKDLAALTEKQQLMTKTEKQTTANTL
jgi:putative transposase